MPSLKQWAFIVSVLIAGLSSHVAVAGPLAVLGDLEGQGQKLDQFIEDSGAFQKNPWGGPLRLRPGAKFVFMGDALDRGPNGMRILDTLVALKKQYPDQVVLLMGNRDVNKLPFRWIFQDAANDLARMRDYLRNINAGEAFEFRRQELAANGEEHTDWDVFESLKGDLAPGGRLSEYLALAQVAYVDEETGGLFVHGTISEQSLGYVPDRAQPIADVRRWVQALNTWARPLSKDLLSYQKPLLETPGRNDKSVIYGRFLDDKHNPQLPADSVIKALQSQGLHYVVAGHTSVGDVPVLMSTKDFRVVLTDNSYAKPGSSAWTRVEDGHIEIGGITNKQKFSAKVPLAGTSNIGTLSADGYRLLGKVDGGKWLEWQVQGTYRSVYRQITDAELCNRRLVTAAEK